MKKAAAILILCIMLLMPLTSAMAMDYGDYLNSAVEFMQDMYYLDMDEEEALKAALKGIFGGLDPYSSFYDREESQRLTESLEGSFSGIGIAIERCPEGVRITKVYNGSPAEGAGLWEGDIILAVNGVSTYGKDADVVASEIRGEEGTTVTLTIQRQSSRMDVAIKRGIVVINPVVWRIEGDVAYIHIDTFNSNTGRKFSEAMEQIKQAGITKILLDLRDNPGGFVDEAVDVARKLVPEGLITRLDFKSERLSDTEYYSSLKNSPYLVAVLVNENTASAAEILAGAIQDSGKGVLVGQKTYGKGVVQNMFSVLTPQAYAKYSRQYGLKFITEIEWLVYQGIFLSPNEILGTISITTGHYLTRNGRQIHGVGLAPDVEAANRTLPNGIDLMLVGRLTNDKTLTLNDYGNDVDQAERILRAAGYFEGVPDKLLDEETQAAIKKFQSSEKIRVTGNIDATTRDRLNMLLDTLRTQHDPQYVKGMEVLKMF
ncbi:MAG TPA: S41 family peptidase [Thermoclostridium sp.]|nr:S41 family peptidase [Thermoclostridium sp.]HPU44984.1 S41 family peptidase [Thermoclostridium sp.]